MWEPRWYSHDSISGRDIYSKTSEPHTQLLVSKETECSQYLSSINVVDDARWIFSGRTSIYNFCLRRTTSSTRLVARSNSRAIPATIQPWGIGQWQNINPKNSILRCQAYYLSPFCSLHNDAQPITGSENYHREGGHLHRKLQVISVPYFENSSGAKSIYMDICIIVSSPTSSCNLYTKPPTKVARGCNYAHPFVA